MSVRPAIDPHPPSRIIADVERSARLRTTPCGDGKMVWRSWGEGRPLLVLLHGNFGAWTHWIRNVVPLCERFEVVAPDLPGFGDSAMPPDPISARSLSRLLADGMRALFGKRRSLVIAGFSFGANLAAGVARECGERVDRVVLVSGGGFAVPRGPVPAGMSWRGLPEAARRAAHRENLRRIMIADPARIDDLAVEIQMRNAERRRLPSKAVSAERSLLDNLPALRCRLAGIWGGRDPSVGPFLQHRAELLRRSDPQARVELFEQAGHWLPYEAPERFNATLADILSAR